MIIVIIIIIIIITNNIPIINLRTVCATNRK